MIMKHSIKITLVLLGMFFIAQLIGLAVIDSYSPKIVEVFDENGTLINKTVHNLPYGMEPPENIDPKSTLISIIIAIVLAVVIMLSLMKFGASTVLRYWFFFVIILALGITINSPLKEFFKYSSIIAIIIAIPLAYFKVFRRSIVVHNVSELMIYPGIASIFVPLLSVWTAVILLIIISIYDIYAVWHAGFMQKMAKYQIKTVRVFSGFFIPYLGKKERDIIAKSKKSGKQTNMKVNIAILGGGDVVFPIILSGVVLNTLGFLPALMISIFATLALAYLFYTSKKGKFYPAMPFITAGCLLGLLIGLLF